MSLEDFKPALTALALPPASVLLLTLLGPLLLGYRSVLGRLILWLGLLGTWALSCNATAVFLSKVLLPTVAPVSAAQIKSQAIQAIVVLGGGMQRTSPEYGAPQLNAPSLVRVRYGAWLARQTGMPLAFSGGVGWASAGTLTATEASGAEQAFKEFGLNLRWAEDQARDTAESAVLTRKILKKDGVDRIALVTHSWHMPRSVAAFEAAGFTVTPAPMGFIQPESRELLEWLPSNDGVLNNRTVIREWLGILMSKQMSQQKSQLGNTP